MTIHNTNENNAQLTTITWPMLGTQQCTVIYNDNLAMNNANNNKIMATITILK